MIHDQDHTLGNCIRYQLLQDSRIRFAGYKKPHPLEEKIEIKVQTNGEVPPPDAILQSCQSLNLTLDKLLKSFQEEINQFKGNEMSGFGGDGGKAQEDQPMQMPYWW